MSIEGSAAEAAVSPNANRPIAKRNPNYSRVEG
jgi:hypothetical protein